jgi:uncharacterized ParB-like nuclease family protein
MSNVVHFGEFRRPPKSERPASIRSVASDPPKPQRDIVSCAVDGQLYDVEFSGKDVVCVYTVHYRRKRNNDRIEQVRYRQWSAYGHCRRAFDPAVVTAVATAARTARDTPRTIAIEEAALEQLRQRHAKLLGDAAKVEAMIATMQRGEATEPAVQP